MVELTVKLRGDLSGSIKAERQFDEGIYILLMDSSRQVEVAVTIPFQDAKILADRLLALISAYQRLGSDAKCFYCGEPATQRDHIIPYNLQGPEDAWNIVPACAACNSKRPKKGQDVPRIMGRLPEERRKVMKTWLIEFPYFGANGEGLVWSPRRGRGDPEKFRQKLEAEWAIY